MANTGRNFSLTDHQQRFVSEQVANGRHASGSEVIREALRRYGNLSSAFVYFVLKAALCDHAPGGWWWLSSFGAGFTCHGALLAVE